MTRNITVIKKYKQQKATKSEINFSDFCKQRGIECVSLDALNSKFYRKKYLINPEGKCPDFWCRRNGQEIFVEIKTLTNITNAEREKKINNAIENGINRGESIIQTSEVFDPKPELRGPFENFLRDASSKFKNIKVGYGFPKILILNNIINARFLCNAIFIGAYDACPEYGEWELRKRERGLFDKTGSNVSAVVFWNKEAKCFFGNQNTKAKIEFSEDNFNLFFGRLNF